MSLWNKLLSGSVNSISNNSKLSLLSNKSGAILVIIIVLSAAAAGIATSINKDATLGYAELRNMQDSYQASMYASSLSSVIKTGLFMMDDYNYDTPNDTWAKLPPLPIDKGQVLIQIKPLNARININQLMLKNKHDRIYKALVDTLHKGNQDLKTADKIDKWIHVGSVTDKTNREQIQSYKAFKNPLQAMTSIRIFSFLAMSDTSVDGGVSDSELYKLLTKHFTTSYNDDLANHLNVNFADADTIKAYIPELGQYADDIVKYRNSNGYYKTPYDLKQVIKVPELWSRALSFLTVRSKYYYIKVAIKLDKSVFYFHYLVERANKNAVIKSYVEGGADDYY